MSSTITAPATDVSLGGSVSFLAIPVATFEIILLPFWLLFRGFSMPEESEHIGDAA